MIVCTNSRVSIDRTGSLWQNNRVQVKCRGATRGPGERVKKALQGWEENRF